MSRDTVTGWASMAKRSHVRFACNKEDFVGSHARLRASHTETHLGITRSALAPPIHVTPAAPCQRPVAHALDRHICVRVAGSCVSAGVSYDRATSFGVANAPSYPVGCAHAVSWRRVVRHPRRVGFAGPGIAAR